MKNDGPSFHTKIYKIERMKKTNQNYQVVTYHEDTRKPKYNREKERELITRYCIKVARNATFPTDYQDVYDHLFGNPNYIIQFIVPSLPNAHSQAIYQPEMEILGFLVACQFKGYKETTILHCHGIILDPKIQNKGLAKQMVKQLLQQKNPDILTAKTHNPRAFNLFSDALASEVIYPNRTTPTPMDIYHLVKQNPFIANSDDKLIVRNAYPDEKLQQDYRNRSLEELFANVNPRDAQSIVVVYHSKKLEVTTNQPEPTRQGGRLCLKKSVRN